MSKIYVGIRPISLGRPHNFSSPPSSTTSYSLKNHCNPPPLLLHHHRTKHHQCRGPHLAPLPHVNCCLCCDGGDSGVPVVSRLPHPHPCCQSVVHCCHRMSLRPGRRTYSCTIFAVLAPCWVAALLVTFLLHQTQSTTHCCHHCTPPPLCQS